MLHVMLCLTDAETHFKVVVVSNTFDNMSLLKVSTC